MLCSAAATASASLCSALQVQLTELRRRLAAGVPLAEAAQIMPLFAGLVLLLQA